MAANLQQWCQPKSTTLKSLFSRHGIPDVLFSDNGTNFSSYKFKEFAKEWEFEHKTSSPLHSQSNGLAERFVQTVKNIFRKADYEHKDKDLALLELRNTPISHDVGLKTPSELLMGRQTKGLLPVNEKHEKDMNVQSRLYKNANQQKYYYDRNTRKLPELAQGQNVIIKDNVSRKPNLYGQVISRDERPNAYVVRTEKGNVIYRNRRYLIHNKSDVNVKNNNTYYRSGNLVKENNHSPDSVYDTVNPNDNFMNDTNNVDVNLDTSIHNLPKSDIDLSAQNNCDTEVYRSRVGRSVKRPRYLSEYVTD